MSKINFGCCEGYDCVLQRPFNLVADQVAIGLSVIPDIFTLGVIGAPIALVAREVEEVGYLLSGKKELSKVNRMANGISHKRDFLTGCAENFCEKAMNKFGDYMDEFEEEFERVVPDLD